MIIYDVRAKIAYIMPFLVFSDPFCGPGSVRVEEEDKTWDVVFSGFFVFLVSDAFFMAYWDGSVTPSKNADKEVAATHVLEAFLQGPLGGNSVVFHNDGGVATFTHRIGGDLALLF